MRRERTDADRLPRIKRKRFENRLQLRFIVGSIKTDRPPAAVVRRWAPDAQHVAFRRKHADPIGFGLRTLIDVGRRRPVRNVDGEVNEVLQRSFFLVEAVDGVAPASYCTTYSVQATRRAAPRPVGSRC